MAHYKTLCLLYLLMISSTCLLASACIPCGKSPPAAKYPPAVSPPKAPSPVYCPKDTLKLGVCADLLGGLVSLVIGVPPESKCCTLLQGLADLEAAVCLCTAIKANVLGLVNLDVPVALSLLVNACGKKVPDGFKCA